jgi:hypothetical protein
MHVTRPPEDVSGLMLELLEWWNKESTGLSPVSQKHAPNGVPALFYYNALVIASNGADKSLVDAPDFVCDELLEPVFCLCDPPASNSSAFAMPSR